MPNRSGRGTSNVSSTAVPKQVSRFEASLLRILRFFFGQVPAEEALPLVRSMLNRPRCLSPDAVGLIRDTLSKGCVLYLIRAGGWKRERFLRNGEPKTGRLWERSPTADLKLNFSAHSMEFLLWLTATRPGDASLTWKAPENELTTADQLLLFLAYESLRDEPDLAASLKGSPSFTSNALIRLFHPNDFVDDERHAFSFTDWFAGTGALILEALQPSLEACWLEIERTKGQIGDWDRMRQQGRTELMVLDRFLEASEKAGRLDLSRFLLGVLAKLLAGPEMTPVFWTGGLQGSGPPRLADRLEVQRSALSLLSRADRLRQWEQRARRSGFMDEDYAASQFWLGEWERLNATQMTSRAERIVQMLEPLRNTGTDQGKMGA